MHTIFETSTADNSLKHCGKRRNLYKFPFFSQCYKLSIKNMFQIFFESHQVIGKAEKTYTYVILEENSSK